jgi:protein tyrosine phosphatase (PTP) superfamily phosphohydrolase (DUF442 family)
MKMPAPITPDVQPKRAVGCFQWPTLKASTTGIVWTVGSRPLVSRPRGQFAETRGLGVRHIVNLGLHTHEKALPDEAATVDRLGMTYTHNPGRFPGPDRTGPPQFCTVVEQLKDAQVHVHCIANARVSAFFYRFRRDVLGMDEAQARAEMEAVWQPKGVWVDFVKRR